MGLIQSTKAPKGDVMPPAILHHPGVELTANVESTVWVMLPDSGGILRGVHLWEVPFSLHGSLEIKDMHRRRILR